MTANIATESLCPDERHSWPSTRITHGPAKGRIAHAIPMTRGEFLLCKNFDSEDRHISEPFGFYEFAWLPRRCRNGKVRWLVSVEHHDNGTYTLGDRAY